MTYIEDNKRLFIILPPPNVTGKLHLGHFLDHVLPDALAKNALMRNIAVSWILSLDHAGIATENVVRKKYNTVSDALIQQEIAENTLQIRQQLQRSNLSLNLDEKTSLFTLDNNFSDAVKECIHKLYAQNLLFFGEYLINWCYKCETALSDEEVNVKDKKQVVFGIKYFIENTQNFVVVNTTRPETIFADVCLISKKETNISYVRVPLSDRKIPVKKLTSAFNKDIETDFIKITPSLSKTDFYIARQLELPTENFNLFDEKGFCTISAYKGKNIYETRKIVLQHLTENNLITDTKEHITNSFPFCYRCNSDVDYKISKQLFVDLKKICRQHFFYYSDSGALVLTELLLSLIRINKGFTLDAQIIEWMSKVDRWCISRQISLGHKISIYSCNICKRFEIYESSHAVCCNKAMIEDTYVLDTWFSSALVGSVLYKKYGKQDVLFTGKDIVFFWIIRMIALDMIMLKQPSVTNVCFHGLLKDKDGKKLSKSLNNSPDMNTLIDDMGTDAMRLQLYEKYDYYENIVFNADEAKKRFQKISKKIDSIDSLIKSSNLSTLFSHTENAFLKIMICTFHTITDLLYSYRIKKAVQVLNNVIFNAFSKEYLEIRKHHYSNTTKDIWRLILEMTYAFLPNKTLATCFDLLDANNKINTKTLVSVSSLTEKEYSESLYTYIAFCRVINILKFLSRNSINKQDIYLIPCSTVSKIMLEENTAFLAQFCNTVFQHNFEGSTKTIFKCDLPLRNVVQSNTTEILVVVNDNITIGNDIMKQIHDEDYEYIKTSIYDCCLDNRAQ